MAKRIYFSSKLLRPVAIAACMVLFNHCRKTDHNEEHPAYFNEFYKMVDTSANTNKMAALKKLDAALKAFPNPGIFDLYSIDSIKEDVYSYVGHDYLTAMRYTDSMLILVEKNTSKEQYAEKYARALYYKGNLYAKLKNFGQAFYFNTLAKEIEVSKVKNPCSLVDCNNFIANMFVAQGKYLDAARSFLKAFNAHQHCPTGTYKQLMEYQSNLVNAGITYDRAGKRDSSSWYYTKALQLIESNEQKFPANYVSTNNAKAVIYSDQGQLCLYKKDFTNAALLFKKSIQATRSVDVIFTQYTQLRLAECYLNQGLNADAATLLMQAKLSLDSVSNETALLNWYQLKAKYYEKQNDLKLAYRYLQQYYGGRDSIENRKKEFSVIDVNRRMEEIEQKYLMAVLEKKNESTLNYLYIAIIIIVAAFSVVLLIWQNLLHSKKNASAIENKNVELQRAYASLEQSHQENTRIMSVLAHDLKNPLIATGNLVYFLLAKNPTAPDKEIFQTIQASCSHSLELLNDLLVNKKENHYSTTDHVDILAIVENSIQLLQTLADQKNQQLVLKAEKVHARVNRQEIWRVLSNLLNNAIKYSAPNAIIHVQLTKSAGNFLFSVTDNGIGIPTDLKDKIFTTATEKTRAGTNGEISYGLGLLISKKIIEDHHGQIWFESNPQNGTTFYFKLPL